MKGFQIATSDLSQILSISPQRVLAIATDSNLESYETESRGKFKYYSPSGIRKILIRKGIDLNTKKVIAFCNNKGGVGKSSTAANTAIMLSSMGFKTLLIDSDGQANTTSFFLSDKETFCLMEVLNGKVEVENAIVQLNDTLSILPSNLNNQKLSNFLSASPSRSVLKKLIATLDYDYIIWDCNPSLDSTNQQIYYSCTDIFIVTLMEAWSLLGVEMTKELLIELFDENPGKIPNLFVLINKLDNRIISQINLYSRLEKLELDVFPITIDTDNCIPKSQNDCFLLNNKNKTFKAYLELAYMIITNSNNSSMPIQTTTDLNNNLHA